MLSMVACVISLHSPIVIVARKFVNSDLGGSLTLPHDGSLQEEVNPLSPWYKICHGDQT